MVVSQIQWSWVTIWDSNLYPHRGHCLSTLFKCCDVHYFDKILARHETVNFGRIKLFHWMKDPSCFVFANKQRSIQLGSRRLDPIRFGKDAWHMTFRLGNISRTWTGATTAATTAATRRQRRQPNPRTRPRASWYGTQWLQFRRRPPQPTIYAWGQNNQRALRAFACP